MAGAGGGRMIGNRKENWTGVRAGKMQGAGPLQATLAGLAGSAYRKNWGHRIFFGRPIIAAGPVGISQKKQRGY
jgi:hypothetical protein